MTHPDGAATDAANGGGDPEQADEEDEELKAAIKAGANALLPVLGEEVTAKVIDRIIHAALAYAFRVG